MWSSKYYKLRSADKFMENEVQEISPQYSDTRLKDLEEKNKRLRERLLLTSKNLLDTKEELEEKILELKNQNNLLQKIMEKTKTMVDSLVEGYSNFVKRDEMLLLERMLKDFQPLEFMRKKDVEELINKRKDIKTKKS